MEALDNARSALLFAADAQVDPRLAEFLRFLEKAIGLGIPLDLSKLMVGSNQESERSGGFPVNPEFTERIRELIENQANAERYRSWPTSAEVDRYRYIIKQAAESQ